MIKRLIDFLNASPVNYLAISNLCNELEKNGFRHIDPREPIGKVKRYTKSYEKNPQAQGNTPNP